MGTFVIAQRLNGTYKYEFVSRKGKTIFTSNDFELRFECEEEIERLKNSIDKCVFMRFDLGWHSLGQLPVDNKLRCCCVPKCYSGAYSGHRCGT